MATLATARPNPFRIPATAEEIETEKAIVSALISQTIRGQTPSAFSVGRQVKHTLMDRGDKEEIALTRVRAMLVSMHQRGALIITDGFLTCTWSGTALLPEHRQEIAKAAKGAAKMTADAAQQNSSQSCIANGVISARDLKKYFPHGRLELPKTTDIPEPE